MTYYAVVDIGTNSARLMIAHVEDGYVVADIKMLRMIRVGEGMVNTGCISDAATQRTVDTLREFVAICKDYDIQDRFFCFATSAVRDAKNNAAYIDAVYRGSGIKIEIISGEIEALLGFAGSVTGTGGMFDIGGGSTEVIFGSLQDIRYQHSFRIGTVRAHQMFPGADNADPEAYEKAHEHARETFRAIPDTGGVTFVGIGGTATALAAIDLGLNEYSASRVQGHILTITKARDLCAMLESKTKAQRKVLVGLEEKRADVIVFGSIIMLEFMCAVSAENIIVSDRDNQEGYLAWKLGID